MSTANLLSEHQEKAQAITFMEDLLKKITNTRETLQAIEDGWRENNSGYPDQLNDEDFFSQLTLDAGLRVNEAYINWCRSAIERLKARGH